MSTTILFNDFDHRYFIKEKPEIKLVSVSGLFDMVKPKFDSEAYSKTYAEKGKDKILKDLAKKWEITDTQAFEKWGHLEMTQQDIKDIWEEKKTIGLARGTKWHKDIENTLLGKGGKRGTSIEGSYTRAINMNELEAGKEYVELIIPYLSQFLIGTADRVQILPNKEFIIRDWKSDAKLEYKGTAFYNKYLNEKIVRKLLPPLSHLDDVNGVHYNIKESLYIFFLESYGYKFKEGWIDHVQFDLQGEPVGITEYPITYMKKEVMNLLNWYKTKSK